MAERQLFDEFDRRSWRRHIPDIDLRLALSADGGRWRGTIENISIGGLKLRIDGDPPLADAFTVSHPRTGSFKATRVWQNGPELALRFEFVEALPLLLYCAIGTEAHPPLPAAANG